MNPTELTILLNRIRLARCVDLIETQSNAIVLCLPGKAEREIVQTICHEMIQLGRELERNTCAEYAIAAPLNISKKKIGKKK